MQKNRRAEEKFEQVFDVLEDASKFTEILQGFMLGSNIIVNSFPSQDTKLLEEIEGFLQEGT